MSYQGKKPRRGIVLMMPPAVYFHTALATMLLFGAWCVTWFFYPRTSGWFRGWYEPMSGWGDTSTALAMAAFMATFAAAFGAFAWIYTAWEKHSKDK